jgi:serine phosphatase RsbU (regulator of sigma subunit)/PAS domain-containing protein
LGPIQQSTGLRGAGSEIAGLKARYGALRQAAALPGADAGTLLEAALAELDAALAALTTADGAEAGPDAGGQDPSGAAHAERRLLHAVFQQAPVPLFLLGADGTVRRANAAAGDLFGAGPGYVTGKAFTAFIDLPSRPAATTQFAAAARKGETRQFRCGLLTAAGAVEHVLAVHPVSTQGAAHLVVAVTGAGTGPAGRRPKPKSRQAAEAEPEVVQAMTRRLDLVMAATRILLENITYSEPVTLQRYARLLARELAAWVIVDVAGGQRLRRQHVSGPEDQHGEKLAHAVAGVDPEPGSGPYQVHESGSTLLIAHAEDAGALGDGPDGVPLLMLLGATSVLSVPLTDGEHAYGVLTLARWTGHPHFEIADVGLVEELGEQLALAIRVDRMFRHRADVADALQTSLLPRQVRQVPGTEIAAEHIAAATAAEAGGDFYDVYPSRGGWGVAIGDVCGTGPDTAAVTAAARHAIRALAHLDPDPAAVLRGINEIMLAEDFGGRFVTADAGHLSWRDGRLRLSLSSAGHPGPVLLRPDGRTQVLDGGGLPLGIFPDAEPASQDVELDPGDLLFLYTDGLTSACGPDQVQFEERLTDELAALAGQTAAALVSRVREVVLELSGGELRDDVTMLALRVGDPPA